MLSLIGTVGEAKSCARHEFRDEKMGKIYSSLFVFMLTSLLLTCCQSSYDAMSENSYTACVQSVNDEMIRNGFTLVQRGSENGYHDKETYRWEKQGEIVEYTIEAHRSDNHYTGIPFVDDVSVVGCRTSNAANHDRYCSKSGIVPTTVENNQQLDVKGTRFSPGKTVVAVIFSSLGLGVLYGILIGAAQ